MYNTVWHFQEISNSYDITIDLCLISKNGVLDRQL